MKRRKSRKTKKLSHLLGTKSYRNKLIADKSYDLGIDYENEEKFEQALTSYNKAIKFNPKDSSYFYNRANLYKNLGRLNSALADYNKAIAINPNHSGAYNNRGLIHSSFGYSDKALEDFTLSIETGLESHYSYVYMPYINRSDIYLKQCNLEFAEADCNEAIKINPTHAPAYLRLGDICCEQGYFETALENYNKAIKFNNVYKLAFKRRVIVHRKLGLEEFAIMDENRVKVLAEMKLN